MRVVCRQLKGMNKIRGIVTVSTTALSICTAFLLWRYKPQVIKVRGELAHTLINFGKMVGDTLALQRKQKSIFDLAELKQDAASQVRAAACACLVPIATRA